MFISVFVSGGRVVPNPGPNIAVSPSTVQGNPRHELQIYSTSHQVVLLQNLKMQFVRSESESLEKSISPASTGKKKHKALPQKTRVHHPTYKLHVYSLILTQALHKARHLGSEGKE